MKPFPDMVATERLILRPPAAADADDVLAAASASYPELQRWMEWARSPYGIDQARQFCSDARVAFDNGKDFNALVTLADDDTVIGTVAILLRDEAVPSFEIGYWLHSGYTGFGYATEATGAMTRLAFEEGGCRRVEARIDERNRPSRAVVERLGYEFEGTLKSHRRDNEGRLSHIVIYAITNLGALRSE